MATGNIAVDRLNAQIKQREDAMARMVAAHAGGHDPCDCLSPAEVDECMRFCAIRKKAVESIINAVEPVEDAATKLERLYGEE